MAKKSKEVLSYRQVIEKEFESSEEYKGYISEIKALDKELKSLSDTISQKKKGTFVDIHEIKLKIYIIKERRKNIFAKVEIKGEEPRQLCMKYSLYDTQKKLIEGDSSTSSKIIEGETI